MCRTSAMAMMVVLLTGRIPALGWLNPATDPTVVVIKDSQDGQFSFVFDPESNYGGSGSARLKGWQEVTVLKFDLAACRGRTVQDAELHLCRTNTDPLLAMVAATINSDWPEGRSAGWEARTGESCWLWRKQPANEAAASPTNYWTFANSDFASATFGNYGSLACYAYSASDTFGSYTVGSFTWVRMKLDPAIISAMALDQYGLTVTDPRGYLYDNPSICTKEGGGSTRQPKICIKFAETTDATPPEAVGNLTAQAGPDDGDAVLRFTSPSDPGDAKAFGYTVRYSTGTEFAAATNLDRWRIPRPFPPGAVQQVLIENLVPGTDYTFFVQAYDATGNAGPVQAVSFTLPPSRTIPILPQTPLPIPDPAGKDIRTVPNVLRYWAASEVAKIDPGAGREVSQIWWGGGFSDNYKKANVVWDAGTNTIQLTGCRNEVVGCQLLIQRLCPNLTNVNVTVGDLVGPGGDLISAATCTELSLLHYTRKIDSYSVTFQGYYVPEPAIPLAAPLPTTFSIPEYRRNRAVNDTGGNPICGVVQSVWLDLYVPKTAVRGDYTGTVTLTATELAAPVAINLKLHASPVTIPDYPTFVVDLNGYYSQWNFGTDPAMTCLRYFQACHKHRAVPNCLPYGWSGGVEYGRGPSLSGQGATLHASDWTAFDGMYGRFFDGSAFRPDTPGSPYCGPGENTPIAHFYTGFNEMWPVSMIDATYGFDAAGLGGGFWEAKLDSPDAANQRYAWLNMPDVMAAWPDGYKQGVRNIVADWCLHAQAKGWTRTAFQAYLNDKYSYTSPNTHSLWALEECIVGDDFRAVGFFHQLYRQGQAQANTPEVQWHSRIDISYRWGQNYGQLDDRINVNDISDDWAWPNIKYRRYSTQDPEQWWWYGGGEAPDDPGQGYARLFLQKWSQGFAGGLPHWDNYQMSWTDYLGGPHNSWIEAADLALVYAGNTAYDMKLRYDGPMVSARLKMMRQAQQLIEMLNLWSSCPGMSRRQVRDAVAAAYGDGAWDYSFYGIDEIRLYQLRADLVAQLESALFAPGDINGDGLVDMEDVLRFVDSWALPASDPGFDSACDLNHDGLVDVVDLLILVKGWNRTDG